eukprot:359081-Chlamydomonas_euryale.AAC.2
MSQQFSWECDCEFHTATLEDATYSSPHICNASLLPHIWPRQTTRTLMRSLLPGLVVTNPHLCLRGLRLSSTHFQSACGCCTNGKNESSCDRRTAVEWSGQLSDRKRTSAEPVATQADEWPEEWQTAE